MLVGAPLGMALKLGEVDTDKLEEVVREAESPCQPIGVRNREPLPARAAHSDGCPTGSYMGMAAEPNRHACANMARCGRIKMATCGGITDADLHPDLEDMECNGPGIV